MKTDTATATSLLDLKAWINSLPETDGELDGIFLRDGYHLEPEMHMSIMELTLSDGSTVKDCSFRFAGTGCAL